MVSIPLQFPFLFSVSTAASSGVHSSSVPFPLLRVYCRKQWCAFLFPLLFPFLFPFLFSVSTAASKAPGPGQRIAALLPGTLDASSQHPLAKMRQLKGKPKKETSKDKKERKQAMQEARQQITTVVLPTLAVVVLLIVVFVYVATRPAVTE
ncbi:Single-pass membrane and coiled-coil domain-containing protein 4 [Microtus ochrogaster]|uniref:Single-pass membrane and coiled-coil domain-containing protein 4 n=1 Tax=Microtus ochrogaster TaxID=79684 RepID=A0A8J6GSI9_MICOH|nr:Single-pass membrane and coiled-coil domain-containing protein 4 [Microtus ochrogaster]